MPHVPETDNLILCLCLRCLKASAYNAGDLGSIPGSGSSPGEGSGTPLQYSCLENPFIMFYSSVYTGLSFLHVNLFLSILLFLLQ